jgi:hypothetical protein
MKIAVLLSAHQDTEIVLDTIESIKKYVSDDILLICDGARWSSWGEKAPLPVYKMSGFFHNYSRAPYRNITFGLYHVLKLFKEIDWVCYTEYDTVFASDAFKEDLEEAAKEGVWCLGNDVRSGDFKFPLLENMIKSKISGSRYLLGCCVFYHIDFLRKLEELNFFEKFLYLTNDFTKGFFPGYEEQWGYDLAEHLYPTLAHHYGGGVRGMACWSGNRWTGSERFKMRWKPEIEEDCLSASIFHPLKAYDNSIRLRLREQRRSKG